MPADSNALPSSPRPCPGPLDLTDAVLMRDPYPVYAWYRHHDPVHCLEPQPGNSGGVRRFLVTRWQDCAEGLRDSRLRREVHKNALWNQPPDQVAPEFASYARVLSTWPLFKDPPRHAKVRRPVNRVLDEAMSRAAAPLLNESAEEVLRQVPEGGEFDVIQDYARILPLEIDRRLFGLEPLPTARLSHLLQTIGMALGNVFNEDRIRQASQAIDEVSAHLEEALARLKARPASPDATHAPMLRRLVDLAETDGLLEKPLLVPIAILLLQAAQDSVIGALSNGLFIFLRHPEALTRCLETSGPEGFASALPEVLRFESPVQQVTRHAAEDLEVGGRRVQAGEGVSFLLGAANRDPAVFAEPEVFLPGREMPRTAAFGFGAHTCPGMDLGGRIAVTGWEMFFRRFPRLKWEESSLLWRPTVTFRTVGRLMVRPGD